MNYMNLSFKAIAENESFIRTAIAGFLLYLDPDIEQINDIKTAVSEAVTNAVLYAYDKGEGDIYFSCSEKNRLIEIQVKDTGIGIEDVERAKEPFYSTDTESERAGLGFVMMESFMDSLDVKSVYGEGTVITMTKKL